METDTYYCPLCGADIIVYKDTRPPPHNCPEADNMVVSWVKGGLVSPLRQSIFESAMRDVNNLELEKKGFWFVYGRDTQAYPLLATDDELTAYKFALDHHGNVMFWEFGIAWDDLEK